MFVQKVKSAGLSHLSYLIGDGSAAAVIDPRRDCDIYIEVARERGCRITHIFETHCHEDFVSGASLLAKKTGAPVFHGPNAAGRVAYAQEVCEGETFTLNKLMIRVLETPGHTDDSLSYAIYDMNFGDQALGVFTGDTLFIGNAGRADFYPHRAEEVAGLLFDSLHKICELGDQALVYPAHGAGSICGSNMADREFSTIGYERRNNPALLIETREAFIERKVSEHHHHPPYFNRMERVNLQGASSFPLIASPLVLSAGAFYRVMENNLVVDVRDVTAFLGAHLPGSLAIPHDMLPAFAGWLLEAEEDLVLVASDATQAKVATRHLARMGYDRVRGYLSAELTGWAARALPFHSLDVVEVHRVAERVRTPPRDWMLLDVRSKPEVEEGVIEGARHVYVGHLPGKIDELEPQRRYTVMCSSGARAAIAASILRRAGFTKVDVFLGSMGAWKAAGFSTEPLADSW